MLLSQTALIVISIAIGLVIAIIVRAARRKGSVRTILASGIFFALVVGIIANFTMPEVVCVGPDETHDTYRAPFGYTDPEGVRHSLEVSKDYVYNNTGEDAIVYPVTYGENKAENFPVLCPAGRLTEVPHCPTEFYAAPAESVKSHAGSKTVWHLDTPQKMIERRMGPFSTAGQ